MITCSTYIQPSLILPKSSRLRYNHKSLIRSSVGLCLNFELLRKRMSRSVEFYEHFLNDSVFFHRAGS